MIYYQTMKKAENLLFQIELILLDVTAIINKFVTDNEQKSRAVKKNNPATIIPRIVV